MSSSTQQPPSYASSIRTIYDETHRGVWHPELTIQSMGNKGNLLGLLEHHEPTTDGTFSICLAGGEGIFISKTLYESIPEDHRPTLDTSDSGKTVGSIFGDMGVTTGSAYFPFLLIADNNEKVRIVLKVYVLPKLLMGVFWGNGGSFGRNVDCSILYDQYGVHFTFDFKNGQKYIFEGTW